MKHKTDVHITINGLQMTDGEPGRPLTTVAEGRHYYKNGCHYVFYEERQEGFDCVQKSRLRIRPDFLEIRRQGVTGTLMVFENKKKTVNDYNTPFGSLQLGIRTTQFELTEEKHMLFLRVCYDLEMEGKPVAVCSVRIHIKSNAAG